MIPMAAITSPTEMQIPAANAPSSGPNTASTTASTKQTTATAMASLQNTGRKPGCLLGEDIAGAFKKLGWFGHAWECVRRDPSLGNTIENHGAHRTPRMKKATTSGSRNCDGSWNRRRIQFSIFCIGTGNCAT